MIEPIKLLSVFERDNLIKISLKEKGVPQFCNLDRSIYVIIDGNIILETREKYNRYNRYNSQSIFYLFYGDNLLSCRAVCFDEALIFLSKYDEIQAWFMFNMLRFI